MRPRILTIGSSTGGPQALNALLEWAGHKPSARFDPNERRERDIDRLADAVEQHMDMEKLAEWLPMLRNDKVTKEKEC